MCLSTELDDCTYNYVGTLITRQAPVHLSFSLRGLDVKSRRAQISI